MAYWWESDDEGDFGGYDSQDEYDYYETDNGTFDQSFLDNSMSGTFAGEYDTYGEDYGSWWDTSGASGAVDAAGNWYDKNENWVDPLVNLGAGYFAGNKAEDISRQSAEAQRQAAQLAYERSLPWNTGGLFGAAAFDPKTRTAIQTLSPELRKQYDAYMKRSGTHEQYIPEARADFEKQRGYAAELEGDVYGAGKKFYEMQKALYAPQQEKDRLTQEARLLAQGRLGSTGGAGEQEALRKAQGQVDLQAQYAGLDKAQQQIGMFRDRSKEGQALEDMYRARQASDLAMVQSLGQLPTGYAQTGRGIGTGMSPIAATAAGMQKVASQGMADTSAAKWGGLATGIGNYLGPKPASNTYDPSKYNLVSK